MLGSSVLEVAIGLATIFLVFSLVASGIYEAGAKVLAWRSKALWAAVRLLLDEEAPAGTHPGRVPRLRHAAPEGDLRPIAAPTQAQAPTTLSGRVYSHPLVGALDRSIGAKTRIDRINPTSFSRALIDTLVPDGNGQTTVEGWRVSIAANAAIPSPLKRQLLLLVNEASGDLDSLRSKIADWFDGQMEILTQTYRKRARWFMVGIGLGVAVACNVDAVAATRQLYQDDTLRAALVAESAAATEPCNEMQGDALSTCLQDAGNDVATAVSLPVGWEHADLSPMSGLGWAAAGLAISQGAPFWFDVLKRVTGLRSRGSAGSGSA